MDHDFGRTFRVFRWIVGCMIGVEVMGWITRAFIHIALVMDAPDKGIVQLMFCVVFGAHAGNYIWFTARRIAAMKGEAVCD